MTHPDAPMTFHVGNIPYSMDHRELQEALNHALGIPGAILDVRLILSPSDGRSRGFAYVDLAPAAAAQFARLDGALLGSRPIRVRPDSPKMRR